MPAFQPAQRPRFSCWTSRASGNRSRTSSTVPSVEPLSTTIVSCPRTLSRHCSSQGSALYVTTTAQTSPTGRAGTCGAAERLPGQRHRPRQRHRDRDDEEEEARRERRVVVHVQPAQEADEEGLP